MRFNRIPARSTARAARASLCVVLLVGAGTLSSTAAEEPRFPGLPNDPGYALVPRATGTTETRAALQWARIPSFQTIAFKDQATAQSDPSCRRIYPYELITDYSARIHAVSSPSSSVKFGRIGPFTVRTVAFGSIPVEAQIQIRQLRDAQDNPVPFDIEQRTVGYCPGAGPHAGPTEKEFAAFDTNVTGEVEVYVTSLIVDGVDLGLQKTCRGNDRIKLKLTSPDVFSLDPDLGDSNPYIPPGEGQEATVRRVMTSPYFLFINGGLLSGSIDIPPFGGCTTDGGDDVSALLTAAVSGSGNRVQMRSEALTREAAEFECWKTTSCGDLPDMPLPTRAP